ncbi:MAG TPA: hypothetical protein VGK67_03830 [Myxococcales bacterium]
MRSAIVAVALTLGAVGGCTCFEPVGEADFPDAAVAQASDGGAADDAATSLADATAAPVDASSEPRPDAGTTIGVDAGDPFCTGDEPRLLLVGGQVQPVATTSSLVFMNCCEAAEIVFHATDALGALAELHLTSRVGAQFPSGEVTLGMDPNQAIGATLTVGASYYGSGISAAGNRINGTLAVTQPTPGGSMDVKVCLTLDGPQDSNDGARLWAPSARVMAYDWQRRFALYPLADPAMNAVDAAKLDLASLPLAAEPLLDLYSIRYYRRGDHSLAFTLEMTMDRLKAALGTVPVSGKPFVVVADGARIYLGAFWSPVSSLSPTMPFVMIDSSDGRGFTIEKSTAGGVDARGDSRAMTALEQSGKLAP